MGSVSVEAAAAAGQLAAEGIQATVAIVSSFNPDPARDLTELLSGFRRAISLEAQTISGGLAALVASVIATESLACRLSPLAVRTSPDGASGSQRDCWQRHGLDRTAIVETARATLGVAGR